MAAASAVTTSSFAKPLGMAIAFPSTSGFTNRTYDIVKNVVTPARISTGTLEPELEMPKYRSIATLMRSSREPHPRAAARRGLRGPSSASPSLTQRPVCARNSKRHVRGMYGSSVEA